MQFCFRHSMNRIKSKKQRIGTYKVNKISLSCFNDKIHILNNWYDRLFLDYRVIYEKTVILITIQKSFLLSYKNII